MTIEELKQLIERARAGVYPENVAADVSPERLQHFFVRVEGGYQVSKTIRDACVFAKHDVTKDPPFSRLDLISCRNLLIYLGSVLQKRLIPLFHYALVPEGFLILGSSESIACARPPTLVPARSCANFQACEPPGF